MKKFYNSNFLTNLKIGTKVVANFDYKINNGFVFVKHKTMGKIRGFDNYTDIYFDGKEYIKVCIDWGNIDANKSAFWRFTINNKTGTHWISFFEDDAEKVCRNKK